MIIEDTEVDPEGLDALFNFILTTRGLDCAAYKRASLVRRLQHRMKIAGVESYESYLALLKERADEFPQLFDTLFVNVTHFFRDPPVWESLSSHLDVILSSVPSDAALRIWSAGCASGEEAYTLAMLLAEKVGTHAFIERVRLYATDVDEAAVAFARRGAYPIGALEHISSPLRDKYFTQVRNTFVFQKYLRRNMVFGVHDLLRDPPISHIDILACRNTLMYFDAPSQSLLVNRLHFALANGGVLLLGNAELLPAHSDLFVPLDSGRRLFRRAGPPKEVSRVHGASRRRTPNATINELELRVLDITRELALTRRVLGSENEELENSNTTLQATVEELETTKEELQVTNHELAALNDELHSTNGELRTMNQELRQRARELDQASSLFSSVLSSLASGVVVLDSSFVVMAWNRRMEDLWFLRGGDAEGREFFSLDVRAPVETLRDSIRVHLSQDSPRSSEHTLAWTTAGGRTIQTQVKVQSLRNDHSRGVILVVDDVAS